MTRPLRLLAGVALTLGGLATPAVLSPAVRPPAATVHLSSPDAVMAATTTTTSSTALYRFSALVGGKPVRWNPCAAIHWRFRTTYAPTGALTLVRSVVAKIASVTGTTWVYDGPTTAVPTTSWLPKSNLSIRPVLIGWTDGTHSDLLAGRSASTLGVTRTAYFSATVDGVLRAATKAGVIALDRTDHLALTGAVSWKTTLLHEMGHLMGLDHVGNTRELMYPTLSRSLYGLQSGDVAGLGKLGRSAGCIDLGF